MLTPSSRDIIHVQYRLSAQNPALELVEGTTATSVKPMITPAPPNSIFFKFTSIKRRANFTSDLI